MSTAAVRESLQKPDQLPHHGSPPNKGQAGLKGPQEAQFKYKARHIPKKLQGEMVVSWTGTGGAWERAWLDRPLDNKEGPLKKGSASRDPENRKV